MRKNRNITTSIRRNSKNSDVFSKKFRNELLLIMSTSKIEEIRSRLEEVEVKVKVLTDTMHFKASNVRSPNLIGARRSNGGQGD